MRILFCTTDGAHAFNGINAWLLHFLPSLAAAGHEPVVLVFSWSPADECTTTPRLRAAGIKTIVVYPMLYTEAAVRRCLHEVRTIRPAVFVANMVTPALLAMPAIRATGIPCVSLLHNDDAEYQAKARFPADATIVISQGLTRLVPDDGRIVSCIPYGTMPSARQASPPSPGSPLRIVYHGRIALVQKRIVETAVALTRVCRALPGVSADIYGSGPDEEALRRQLAKDDAGGLVRFLGPKSSREMLDLLPTYHVAVLLSDYEGLGLAILEAMAAGVVPVALRTASGLPDLITHDQNGLFVEDRMNSFDAAISRLRHEPDTWNRLSRSAYATVEKNFHPDRCIRDWENLLARLPSLQARGAGSIPPLPPPEPALLNEDMRHPGYARALWRRIRFGRAVARRVW